MLMGNIAAYSQDSAQPKYYIRYKLFEPYIQDDFHIRKNLTLNLGLRVGIFGTFREINRQVFNWDPGAYDVSQAPTIDAKGNKTGAAGALIIKAGTNPYDGIVQCGAAGVPLACMCRSSLQSCAPHRFRLGSIRQRKDFDPRRLRSFL